MKKKLAVLLALAMSVACMTACGEDETTTENKAVYTPSVEIVDVEELDLAKLPVEEYMTLGEYKNLTITVTPKAELDEATIDSNTLSYYYTSAAGLKPEDFLTEGTVSDTDVVLIDYEGKKDNVAFDGGTASDAVLGIGSNSFIDGFEDGLVGVKVGETVDLNLTFPESYTNKDLAGQDVVFTVTVKGVAHYDDETIAKFAIDGITTLSAYREAVAANLLYNIENTYYQNLNNAIVEALLENNTVTKIPKSVFESEKAYAESDVNNTATYYGMDAETLASIMTGMSLSDYASSAAEASTIQMVMMQGIANAEGIVVTDEEVDSFVEEYVAAYGSQYGFTSTEDFYEYNSVETVRSVLLQEKIVELVNENATIVDAE